MRMRENSKVSEEEAPYLALQTDEYDDNEAAVKADNSRLNQLGYKQELRRTLS
ncbi:hypothetical protein MKW92_045248, partial [Papaver armeniacum]